MTVQAALVFVRRHGVVLESARGPVPNLAEAVAGNAISGSWWGHAKGREIFSLTRAVRDSSDVLICRLVGGKVTFVHRRLWPALVRVAHRFKANQLAQVHQEHTSSGHHVSHELPFPKWVPPEVIEEAQRLSEQEACRALGPWTAFTD